MKTHTPRPPAMPFAAVFAIVVSFSAATMADEPSPTPTPHPRKLGDIKLKTGNSEPVVISDANLAEMADRGRVTVGLNVDSGLRGGTPRRTPVGSDRTRWRKVVLAQKGLITELERKRLLIEAQIDLIEDGRLSIRALARIQRAEIELHAIERKILSEKKELSRLIRDARRHGAEPGWFR